MKVEQYGANDPQYSRIFVRYDKYHSLSEFELKEIFGKFGTIENIYIANDRHTNNVRGIAYIKYTKTSEAFKAIETMNGQKLDSSSFSMRVSIATSSARGRNHSDIEFNKLYLVVPKTDKETDVENVFSEFGEISKVHIATNNYSGLSLGIAFVTYTKCSSAALAIEQCEPNYKAKFAKTKYHNGPSVFPPSYSRAVNFQNPTSNYASLTPPSPPNCTETDVLTAYTSPIVTSNELFKIVNIVPDLKFVKELPQQEASDRNIFEVGYNSSSAAKHAVNRIRGYEYPPGHPITLKYSMHSISVSVSGNSIAKDSVVLPTTVTETVDGITNDHIGLPLMPKRGNENVFLPSTDNSFKLFFKCTPVIPPKKILKNCFKRLKGLMSINVIEGKNYGYVTYDCLENAASAIDNLNNIRVYNSRLNITVFEPREPNSKRMKPDTNLIHL